MKDLWDEIPQSEKKTIPISNYKWVKFATIPIKINLNPNDFEISIEELEQTHEGMIEI